MNSALADALADKEFVLSLHHKLHGTKMSTCINKPNGVHKHNQSINHFNINNNVTFPRDRLSPDIYSKKESYKTHTAYRLSRGL